MPTILSLAILLVKKKKVLKYSILSLASRTPIFSIVCAKTKQKT